MFSIMGFGEHSHPELSIHDLDINNRNRLLFEKAAKVVNDRQNLSVAFFD